MKSFLIILTLFFYKSIAQPVNGNDWLKCSDVEKSFLCIGLKSGTDAMANLCSYYSMDANGVDSKESVKTQELVRKVYNKYISGTSALPFLQGIDKYYSDYRNIKIPLSKVFIIVALELSGESDEMIQKIIVMSRKSASGEEE